MALQVENAPTGYAEPELLRYLNSMFQRTAQDLRLLRQEALGFSLTAFVAKGYGGLTRPSAANIGTIGVVYETIPFSQVAVAEPVDVVQDFANDGIRIERAGVWVFMFQTSIQHDDVNSGRNMNFRLRNLTNNTTISSWKSGTGRNTEWTRIAVPILFDVPDTILGDLLVMQVNAGIGTYLGAACWDSTMSANHVSELQDIAP